MATFISYLCIVGHVVKSSYSINIGLFLSRTWENNEPFVVRKHGVGEEQQQCQMDECVATRVSILSLSLSVHLDVLLINLEK